MAIISVPFAMHHLPSVCQIENSCFSDPWSKEGFQAETFNPLSLFLVAQEDQVVTGYLCASVDPPMAYISNLAVSPHHRRKGVATTLLCDCFDWLKKSDVTSVSLEVRYSNLSAISLYTKLGFVPSGIRKRYYQLPLEDAVVMIKSFA